MLRALSAFMAFTACLAAADGTGLTARYFPNSTLAGMPLVQRTDATVNFNWGTNGPGNGIPNDHFSVSWVGYVAAPVTGDYTVSVISDDGCRLWLNNQIEINDWTPHPAQRFSTTIHLKAGQKTPIRLEYYERTGSASCKLRWSSASLTETEILASALYPDDGLGTQAPSSSVISPVCIEGYASGGSSSVSVISLFGSASVKRLSNEAFYSNVPLNAGFGFGVYVFTASGGVVKLGATAWTPINPVASDGQKFVIRANDSLLFASDTNGSLVIGENCGVERLKLTHKRRLARTFAKPGYYDIGFEDNQGIHLGAISVIVVGTSLAPEQQTGSLKGEVGVMQNYQLPIVPAGAASEVTAFSSTDLTVVTKDPVGDKLAVSVTPNSTKFQTVAGRIGRNGPVIGAVPFQAFYVDRDAMLSAGVVGWLDTGVEMGRPTIAAATLRVHPYVPGVAFEFSMFAHKSRFVNGKSLFTIKTDGAASTIGEPGFTVTADPITGESVGIFQYHIITPQGESQYCHRVKVRQE